MRATGALVPCGVCGAASRAGLCAGCRTVARTRDAAAPIAPSWPGIISWLLVLAALLLLIVGWDHVVNGIEVLALLLGLSGVILLAGRTR